MYQKQVYLRILNTLKALCGHCFCMDYFFAFINHILCGPKTVVFMGRDKLIYIIHIYIHYIRAIIKSESNFVIITLSETGCFFFENMNNMLFSFIFKISILKFSQLSSEILYFRKKTCNIFTFFIFISKIFLFFKISRFVRFKGSVIFGIWGDMVKDH